jgi:hypothetical protein
MINARGLVGAAALLAAAAAVAAPAQAEPWTLHAALDTPGSLKLSGTGRARYETIDGQVRPGLPASEGLTSYRTTLLVEYSHGPLRIGGEVYDSRAYGARAGSAVSVNEVNTFEPVQAYVAADLKLGDGDKLTLQAGRFLMDIGSRRIIAADDYRNTTNGFTGVRADLATKGGVKATVFVTAPQIRLPDDRASVLENDTRLDRESSDLLLWGAVAERPSPWDKAIVEASYIGLREKDAAGRPTRDRALSTLTVRTLRSPTRGAFDYEAEAGWQFGEISAGLQANAAKLDVAAGFLHLRGAYQFADSWKTRLAVDYDVVTGDGGGPKYGRFDNLYGTRRADWAPSGIYLAVGRANIVSPAVRMELTPSKRFDAAASYRPMWLQSSTDSFSTSNVRDASGAAGRFAGHQIEGRLRYWVVRDSVRLEAYGVLLKKGRFLRDAPNAPDSGGMTKYLSLNLNWLF